jgi:cyclin G-associated kinase
MTDLFKSAMGYFSSTNSVIGGQGNEFVGQNVEVGNVRLRVKKLIAEGMYKNFSFFLLFEVNGA